MSFLRRSALSLSILVCSILPSITYAADPSIEMFGSAEHVILGDKIKLYFAANEEGQVGSLLHLPNGLKLTYGESVSFGDFYGLPSEAISQGNTDAEREKRFIFAFDSFARDPNIVAEAQQILDVVHNEQKILSEGLARGEKPEEIYKKIGNETSRQINCITGGGCLPDIWWLYPGRYLSLEEGNYDHFSTNALIAYQTGHNIAIKEAIKAHQTNDRKRLELAYAMNGFACHFLSDRFAAGHMRAPRIELPANVIPSVLGALLVSIMHDEENPYGLHVHNLRGNHWIAYGDKSYFNANNAESSAILNETLQRSAREIFTAYQQGIAPTENVDDLIPIPDEMGNASVHDISPLFYWDEATQTLMRRTDLSNPYDRHWTADWWAWTTLIELNRLKSTSINLQAVLIRAGLGKQAMQYGLITDEKLVAYLKSTKV